MNVFGDMKRRLWCVCNSVHTFRLCHFQLYFCFGTNQDSFFLHIIIFTPLFVWVDFFFTWSLSLFVKTFVCGSHAFPSCHSMDITSGDSTYGFVLLFLGHVVAFLLSSILLTLICTVLLMMFAGKNGFVLLFFFLFPSYFTPWFSLR